MYNATRRPVGATASRRRIVAATITSVPIVGACGARMESETGITGGAAARAGTGATTAIRTASAATSGATKRRARRPTVAGERVAAGVIAAIGSPRLLGGRLLI